MSFGIGLMPFPVSIDVSVPTAAVGRSYVPDFRADTCLTHMVRWYHYRSAKYRSTYGSTGTVVVLILAGHPMMVQRV